MKFAALLVLGACGVARAQSTADGLELLHKMQNALGGAEKLSAIGDYQERQSAVMVSREGEPLGRVIKRTRWIRPDILRVDQVGPGNTYVLYFDGTAGWEILPTKDEKKVIALEGGELEFARKYLRDLSFNVWLADRNPRNRIESPGANVLRISDGDDPSHQVDILLDAATGLPVEETTVSLADPAHPVASETRFEEWQSVQGIRFPRRTGIFRNGVRLGEITVEQIVVNTGLRPEDLSTKPADLNPVQSPK
jgi:hypothetical protein